MISKVSRERVCFERSTSPQRLLSLGCRLAPAAQVHVVPENSLVLVVGEKNIGNVFNTDDTQRFLIQLLSHCTLLNCQIGVFYCNYLPESTVDEIFKDL